MKRTQQALRNILWGLIEKTITILCPFVIRTIIIYKLGNEYLGLSSLFSSILQVLSLAELGFGDAIIFGMYKPISEHDNKKVGTYLNTFRKIYQLLGVVILTIGLMVLPFVKRLINGSYPDDINIYILYIIYLLNTVISYFLFEYKESLIKATQRNDINSKIYILCNLVMYILQIVVLLLFKNYYFYAVLLLLCTVAINILRSKVVDREYPNIKCEGTLRQEEIRNLGQRVVGLTINKISQVFRNSFDSIIISAFIGLVCLAQYQNYYYIVSALTIVMNVIMTAVGAGIGNGIASESIKKNYANYKELLFEYSSIATVFTACMLCLMQDFITLWVGEDNLLQFSSVIFCSIYFFSMRLGDVTAIYRQSAGLWWEDRQRPIIEAATNLALNIILVKYLGVNGVIISTIISIVVINIPWATHILFKYYFKMNAKQVFMEMFKYSLKAVLCCFVTYFVCNNINVGSLFGTIILKGLLACLISLVIIIVCNIKNPEVGTFLNRVKIMVRR